MIPLASARTLVTVLSVTYWQQCLSAYTYEHPRVPSAQPDSISEHTDQLTAAQCVARYATSEFRLQSPGFPAPYPPQLQCLYIVEAVSTNICRLQANFLTFDLGDCTSGDHVTIAGQRLCGNLSGARTFRFSSPRSLILFRSGGVSGRRGFDVAISQVPCPQLPTPNRACSRDFSSSSVVLQSPGYPGPYPGDTRCQYVIRAATTGAPELSLCQAQFTFDSFHLDSSDGCTKDRLEIGDQEPVCGLLHGIRSYEFLGELHVDFYSDGVGIDGGFRIGVVQRQCRMLNVPDGAEIPPPVSPSQRQPPVLPLQPRPPVLPPQRQPPVLSPQPRPPVLPPQRQPPVLPPQPRPPLLPPQPRPPVLPPQRQPPVLPPQPRPPVLPPQPRPPLLPPQPWPPVLPPQPQPPVLPPQPPPPALQPMTHTSQFHLPLCCNKVYSGRLFFIVSPGFPFSNANDNVDCVYVIRPYSPSVCRLRIIFKLFWVGQLDSSGGCHGGFLEIDGYSYCDCKIGFTMVSWFENVGYERLKMLRYTQEGNLGNSGGFLLEILQEECTGRSPWSRHDVHNVTVRWDDKDYNTSRHDNVGIGTYNMADLISLEQHDHNEPYTRSKAVDETGRSHQTYFSEVRDKEGAVNVRGQTYRDEQEYSHSNNTVDESNMSVTDHSQHETLQLKADPSNGRDTAIQNKDGIDTTQKEHGINSTNDHNYSINNSDKQIDEFNFVHKCNSCADRKDVGTTFNDNTNNPGNQNHDYNIFRNKTKAPFDGGKDKSDSNTKYCYNDSSALGNSNVSPVHLCNVDVTAVPNDVAANGECKTCRKDCTGGARDEDNCTGARRTQTPVDNGPLQFKTPVERNVVLSQFETERFWSLRESACRVWGFAQWLLQVKRYFWMLFPQLLCPIDSPSQNARCQVLNQVRGWIQSPGYPQAYPNDVRTCYRFQRLTGYCHVQLFMLDFSLEPSANCVKDYILLGGRWRYCGESLLATGTVLDMSSAPQMDVLLVSDGQHSGRGFRALYQHVPCNRREDVPPADCGQVTDGQYFTLTRSGSIVHRSCVYRILKRSTDVCGLRLNFTDFSLPCSAEYLQIDGQAYCGNLAGRSIEVDFFKPEVRIVYNTMDARSKGHFVIQGKQLESCDFGLSEVPLAARVFNSSTQCDIQLSEVRGFVAFPETQLSSSQPSACAYVIHPHNGMCAVQLAFGAFNVPSAANCMSSFLEVHGQRFCNNQLEHRTTVMEFNGRTLRVPFYVEGSPGTYYWKFTYVQLPCAEFVASGGTV